VTIEPVEQPNLPDSLTVATKDGPIEVPWPARTLEWWQMWADSPLADDFTSTDWSELLDTAVLHARLWLGQTTVAPELRLRVAKFGATPEDRARLRIVFAQADDADAKRPRTASAASRYDGLGIRGALEAG
jgi:hypothetical protein